MADGKDDPPPEWPPGLEDVRETAGGQAWIGADAETLADLLEELRRL